MRANSVVAFAAIAALVALALLPAASTQELFSADRTPLERPTPLKILKSGDTAKICDAVSKALSANGFTTMNQDCDTGQFAATKKTERSGEFDKVVLWLERDFEKPKDTTKLYFLYGRFETLAGHDEPVRIKTTPADEMRNVGSLKEALTSLNI